jgi:hypothetical protein
MQATTGDRIVVKGYKVGVHERVGFIVEVRGSDGGPPYVVEWTGHEGRHLYFPGSDAELEHEAGDHRSR